jgi:hypothetical protein
MLLRRSWRRGGWHGLRSGPLRRRLPGEILSGAAGTGQFGAIAAGAEVDAAFDALLGKLEAVAAGAELGYSQGTAWTTLFDDYAVVLSATLDGFSVGSDDLSGDVTLAASIVTGIMALAPSVDVELAVALATALASAITEEIELSTIVAGSSARMAAVAEGVVARALFQTTGNLTDSLAGAVDLGAVISPSVGVFLVAAAEMAMSLAATQARIGLLGAAASVDVAVFPFAIRNVSLAAAVGMGATFAVGAVLIPAAQDILRSTGRVNILGRL